ncbi:MAG: TonB-dependent receptor [Saprospiraceae bacterium]|nr:TonB-dependent receptor [Saprospiraceae bacterium]
MTEHKFFTRIAIAVTTFLFLNSLIYSQIVTGTVVDSKNQGLEGVMVFFLNTTVGTRTLKDGSFVIEKPNNENRLVIRYLGFKEDTLILKDDQTQLFLQLKEGVDLQDVTITGTRSSHSFSLLNPQNVETLTSKEFRKAACCSLAESFQTSNTVDLAYSNAVVGNREIQFLGLRGMYTQQLVENRPVFTGILNTFGYDFIPGTWLDQINIQKGASSALHGAQSMTGAINTGLKKPDLDYPVYVNGYADYHGRFEGNLHLNKSWSDFDHSGIYLHASRHSGFRDHNKDGFFDDAKNNLLNGMIKNTFFGTSWEGMVNAQALHNTRSGGEVNDQGKYSFQQTITHTNLSGNLGYVGFENPSQSTGSIYDLAFSELYGSFGTEHQFSNKEKRGLIQFIYSHAFSDDKHKITVGPALTYNEAHEKLTGLNNFDHHYKEITPGIFADYDIKFGEMECDDLKRWIISTSHRLEYIKSSKLFWTPRASLRYNIDEEWTTRLSIGRGYRFFRLVSDQLSLLTTNRMWIINDLPEYESSWNYGLNLVGKPTIFNKAAELNFDFYVTRFEEQLVLDLDADIPTRPLAIFSSLNGDSRAVVLSGTFSYPITNQITAKTGLRYQDTKQTNSTGFRDQVMIPKWRGLLSIDFESTDKKWLCNFATHYIGKMRLPDKTYYPGDLIHDHREYSKPYFHLQAQANYTYQLWEFYVGCENITNYTQHQAIIDPLNSSGPFFNASEIYAPINGIKPYIGFKYRIEKKI